MFGHFLDLCFDAVIDKKKKTWVASLLAEYKSSLLDLNIDDFCNKFVTSFTLNMLLLMSLLHTQRCTVSGRCENCSRF